MTSIRRQATRVTLAAISCLIAAGAPRDKLAAPAKAIVCSEKAPGVNDYVLGHAEIGAGRMFALIDLRIDWRNWNKSCPTEQDPIVASLTTHTPTHYFPSAFGISLPYEGTHVRIFYDRVQRLRPDLVVPVLSHILVHEIVHILEGTDSHSESGVMKFRWSQSELEQMAIRPMSFSPFDLSLLNSGIRNRHARVAAARDRTTNFAVVAASE
jgi:hypothetical protein